MLNHPTDWQAYYRGSAERRRILRLYSYSDRIRYYWNRPEVMTAVDRLLQNLRSTSIPHPLLSQYLPEAYATARCGEIDPIPTALIQYKIGAAIRPYSAACLNPPLPA